MWLGWVVLGCSAPVSVLVAWSIVRTVRDWLEPTGFAHIVSVFRLALAIFGALLVPVDLYNVASLSDSMTGQLVDQEERQDVVEHAAIIVVLYQVVFLSLCGFLFVLLPLAYFWSEAAVQQPDAPPARAALHAAGFASCFAVIAGLIGLLGTAIQPVAPPPQLESEAWAMQLLQDDGGPLGPAMDAVLGVALLLGALVLASYGAVGLGSLPEPLVGDAAHWKHVGAARQLAQVRQAVRSTREALRVFKSTFGLTGRRMTRAQRRQEDLFKQREEVLQRREQRLEEAAETSARTLCSGGGCVGEGCGGEGCPGARKASALLLLLLLLALLGSLTASLAEQASRSICGAPCGYLVYRHTAPNPADALLLGASALFPLDAGIVLLLLLLVPLGAVLAASHRTGVRFLCMRLWPLRVRGSAAPAVTLAVLHLLLATLAFAAQLLALAPQYATFGAQAYVDSQGAVRPCSLECATSHSDGPGAPPCAAKCQLSGLATTLLTLTLRLPFFGAAWYYAQWLFVGACIVCAISMASRRQQGASFMPLSGGDVDGIDSVDPEAPFSAERSGCRPPNERTPVLGNGPREPRRSGGKRSSSSHKAPGRAERHSGEAQRGERSSGDAAQGLGQGAGQGQWWAQSP